MFTAAKVAWLIAVDAFQWAFFGTWALCGYTVFFVVMTAVVLKEIARDYLVDKVRLASKV